jgi:hypothetical protein
MELPAHLTVVKLIVLGGHAFGARLVVRLLRNPEHARRGRMLTGTMRTIAATAAPGRVAFGARVVAICNNLPVHRVC